MELLYSEEIIKKRIKETAEKICTMYSKDEPLLCVCVLKGAVMFFADMMKELEGYNVSYDFITLSSYSDEINSSGNVRLLSNISQSAKDKNVLIVEDIIDSGYTLSFLYDYFASMCAADVKTVCLIDKPLARKVDIHPDFFCFSLTDSPFIVGYGLDYAQKYRNLKGIYIFNEK